MSTFVGGVAGLRTRGTAALFEEGVTVEVAGAPVMVFVTAESAVLAKSSSMTFENCMMMKMKDE